MPYFLFNLTPKVKLMYYGLQITSNKKNMSQHKRQLKQNDITRVKVFAPPNLP
jgi:hypothetical protein